MIYNWIQISNNKLNMRHGIFLDPKLPQIDPKTLRANKVFIWKIKRSLNIHFSYFSYNSSKITQGPPRDSQSLPESVRFSQGQLESVKIWRSHPKSSRVRQSHPESPKVNQSHPESTRVGQCQAESFTVYRVSWLWLTLIDSGWLWLTLTYSGWLWQTHISFILNF